MRPTRNFLSGLAVLLLLAAFGQAQTILTNTTLSAAVTDSSAKRVVVGSATGISAPSATDGTKETYLYIDRELMDVQAVSSTTITVIRGVGGTAASTHASSALVFVLPAYLSTYMGSIPAGSCTRGNEIALPRIHAASGVISDCNGGQWINGDATQTQRLIGALNNPSTGGTAYTSLETNGTAPGATTEMYCQEIQLPYSKLLTGLGLLNGTTVSNGDLHNVELYDAGGKLLANSTAAGAAASGASTYQKYAFTSPFYAVGPARYFGCFTSGGTGDTVRHTITAVNDNYIGNKITGLTFGTIPASITAPSSFTTALGPYLQLY